MTLLQETKSGFTLLELIGVIIIIAALAVISIPRVLKYVENAKITAVAGDVKNIATAAGAYYADTGLLPDSTNPAASLMTQPAGVAGWRGPYLNKLYQQDPWGKAAQMVTSTASVAGKGAPGNICDLPGGVIGTSSTWLNLNFSGLSTSIALVRAAKIERAMDDGNGSTVNKTRLSCYDSANKKLYLLLQDDRS